MKPLHDELLRHAIELAAQNRATDATRRRAVSTAYYALFHLLTDEAARMMLPRKQHAQFRPLLCRVFEHAQMSAGAKRFATATAWPFFPSITSVGGTTPASSVRTVPVEIQTVATSFQELQQARHDADYNRARTFTGHEAATLVQQAETAFTEWRKVRRDPSAPLFLLTLLANNRLARRGGQ